MTMDEELHDFEQFMKRRLNAAQSYVEGDAAPLGRLCARVSPATFFGPQGGYRQGTDEVLSTYQEDARAFEPGGDTSFEVLVMAARDGMAYWVGFQQATARMHGHVKPIPMKLRVTEFFRREGDEWKLVHRHADSLSSERNEKKPTR
jgi:ketosteroid isomerase-like protein